MCLMQQNCVKQNAANQIPVLFLRVITVIRKIPIINNFFLLPSFKIFDKITLTAKAFHEKVNLEADEIILNGPPSFLTGNIFIRNNDDETLFIRDLPLSSSSEGRSLQNMASSFKLITSLQPGEGKMQRITHKISPDTPPGTY